VTSTDRLGLAARAFFVATVLGLALAFWSTAALQGTLLVLTIGGIALAASRFSFIATPWILVVEGFLAALALSLTLPDGAMVLPYLVVPALLAGVGGSVRDVALVAGLEVVGLALALTLGGGTDGADEGLRLAAPWIVAALGAGLVGVWFGQVRGAGTRVDGASYESARRLLSQLRTVARRLSSGLDPVSLADQALVAVNTHLGDTRSALFVRTEGGVLSPLGYHGYDAKQTLLPSGYLVDRCWSEMRPAQGAQPHGRADTRWRTVLPLRSGTRMIGLVIADAAEAPSDEALEDLLRQLDEQALRLDTALVFDEVRSLATIEERQRVAREIHDGVAQEVASLGYALDELVATTTDDAQRIQLQRVRSEVSRVVSELRLSIFDLRSEISPAAGLGSALSDYVRTVGSRSGLTVHITLDEAPTRLRTEVETELLRIAQEAVTNARKHSNAANLWVDCWIRPPYARITVRDDGTGLDGGGLDGTGTRTRTDSYGLNIMRERAARINATLDIGSGARGRGGRGTRVTVTVGDDGATTGDEGV
jgi:signal transduction histidine kinase